MNKLGFLRGIKESELELMLSWRNSDEVRKNMYNSQIISLEDHKRWWDKTKKSNESQYFMYEDIDGTQGVVAITNVSGRDKNASWAFYASPDAKKGTGSKMEFLALEYVFNDMKLHKLWCEVLGFNTAVIKMHKKFGFIEEGVFREHHNKDHRFVDVYRLGILRSEWGQVKEKLEMKLMRLYGL